MMLGVTPADPFDLQRFIDAQDGVFDTALAELRAGRKKSHWMWFIFPQLAILGHSPTAKFYGLRSLADAQAYLAHPVLGARLRQSAAALLPWSGQRSAELILGPVDAMKLRSSFTLFDQVAPGEIFAETLGAFFGGEPDQQTLALIGHAS